jgi:hypothetical protein
MQSAIVIGFGVMHTILQVLKIDTRLGVKFIKGKAIIECDAFGVLALDSAFEKYNAKQ